MATVRNHGIQRILAKLECSLKAGNYYEAHQMYRTLYFRYLGQKKYAELLDVLFQGAKNLLQHNQQESGCDLAILVVDVLVQSEMIPTETQYSELAQLFGMILPSVAERETFLANALQWSIKGSLYKYGHPQFHQSIAQVFWKEKNYNMARHHFLYSKDGIGCGTMLIELHSQRGFANEVDLFIAQAVFQYLCLQNKTTAKDAFHSYTTHHPNIKTGPPYILPLLNFIWFLLKAIESGKLAAFTVLCEQYQQSIKRDPSYVDYLDKIAQIFFGVAPRPPRSQGFFGNFIQSLLADMDESDSDNETPSRPNASSQQRPSTSQCIDDPGDLD